VVVYLDQPPGRAIMDLDCSRIEELCALGYLAGKACDQKCSTK
jgi:hypothetical protein